MGFLIALAAIALALFINAAVDIRNLSTGNEFINAMLHSEQVYALYDKAILAVSLLIGGLGFCFGWLSFGIGAILSQSRRLSEGH